MNDAYIIVKKLNKTHLMNRLYADGTLCLFSGAGDGKDKIQRRRQSEKTKTQTEREKRQTFIKTLLYNYIVFFSLSRKQFLFLSLTHHHFIIFF